MRGSVLGERVSGMLRHFHTQTASNHVGIKSYYMRYSLLNRLNPVCYEYLISGANLTKVDGCGLRRLVRKRL